jgi:hypothetical protein
VFAATVAPRTGVAEMVGRETRIGATVIGPFDAVVIEVRPELAIAVTLAATCFPASSAAKT